MCHPHNPLSLESKNYPSRKNSSKVFQFVKKQKDDPLGCISKSSQPTSNGMNEKKNQKSLVVQRL
jgi:hypothetical protein